MNLVIDVGNTRVKFGLFNAGKLSFKNSGSKSDFLGMMASILESRPRPEHCIISKVSDLSEEQMGFLSQNFEVLVLDHLTPIPFKNKYESPETLGIDRIALVSAASQKYENKNVLIVDAGTCITYDFLNSENEYLGGAISPGVSLRYKALHTYTHKLPLLAAAQPSSYLGKNTAAAIHTGVVNGVLYEIDGHINEYKNVYDNLTVILTGGDAHFLRDSLKNDIFANSNFLLEGLNHILEYNKL